MAPRSAKPQSVNGVKKGAAAATPSVSASNSSSNKQNFSFDIVAALLLIMRERGITISSTHYELMSALDGNRTADAFQHQFRAVMARAKVLHEQREKGVAFEPVKPISKTKAKGKGNGAGKNAGGGSGGKKRKRKVGSDDDDDDVESAKKHDPNKGPGSIKYEPESESDEDIMLNADAMPGKSPSPGEYYRGKVSKEQPDESITNSSADEIKAEAF